jgi:hydrogenase-4 component E
MIHPVDTILSLVLLSILFSFGSSRLPGLIKVIGFPGDRRIHRPLFIGHDMTAGGILFTLVTLIIRGIVIPLCIYLAIKKVAIAGKWNPSSAITHPCWPAWVDRGGRGCQPQFNVPSISASALLLPTAMPFWWPACFC